MKISKTKLRQIIKEELGTLREEDPAEETALNSPREAGRQWSYENIVNTVGDLVREALEGHDLDADSIRDAIAEALDAELGPVEEELEEGWKEFAQGAGDFVDDTLLGKPRGYSKTARQNRARRDADAEALSATVSQRAARKKEKATSDRERAQDREKQRKAQDIRNRQLDKWEAGQKDQKRSERDRKARDRRHSGFGSDHYVEQE